MTPLGAARRREEEGAGVGRWVENNSTDLPDMQESSLVYVEPVLMRDYIDVMKLAIDLKLIWSRIPKFHNECMIEGLPQDVYRDRRRQLNWDDDLRTQHVTVVC